jgi:hypothetical protein
LTLQCICLLTQLSIKRRTSISSWCSTIEEKINYN